MRLHECICTPTRARIYMYMHTYTQIYINTYTYMREFQTQLLHYFSKSDSKSNHQSIYKCTYTRTHAHTYTYACICTRMHRYKILATTSRRVKQYHRRKYASICICMHIHTYIHIHVCAQPAASVFADAYVGVKPHLCNIHTCPCTSAQNTCKVYVTLTAKKMHIYIYPHTYVYAYMTHENTCACMTPSTR